MFWTIMILIGVIYYLVALPGYRRRYRQNEEELERLQAELAKAREEAMKLGDVPPTPAELRMERANRIIEQKEKD